ncbi:MULTISPECIES: dihydroorotase [unclassified Exiguobacterium]|uniref:dihydroorotase n=1 Tax=unclassified Exiguobacterium TaxID=2644629 RepID=UPI0006F8C427|nr:MULTISPECIES: dihydroorotase [unclassified Exiguobacterium]KQS40183.1 dihydroorotase [Exiguobacterium sp. Leaf196]MDT0171951.1 dihydroorotase [Exiguobacterium sp. BRG2]HAB34624.1 dihydroorotase [Exiguobacterium sp.]HBF58230.1 dihydroorotase [Exiguobacterium sp.]HCV53878.1 dihydroorotase [Exiguobacterium sp.]
MTTRIENARWYEAGQVRTGDIRIEAGKITDLAAIPQVGETVIDASGLFVAPGFVDIHVHLREPGGEHKETIATGTAAAAAGGFTTICPMPNTRPVPDDRQTLDALFQKIEETASVRVLPYAAISKNQLGQELVAFDQLTDAVAFTDDGVGVQTAAVMRTAMQQAARLGKTIVAHCEDDSLKAGCVHEGNYSRREGLQGIPSLAESIHIARDVLIAEETGCHYHVCHVSTKESVRVIRDAKRAGIRVTAEVTPHHLVLIDEDISNQDPNFKMNPPLRSEADRQALLEGLADGTIDCIATDHAPHAAEEKALGIERAPFGITGFETAFPLLYTKLVAEGKMTLETLIRNLTDKAAAIFELPYGKLEVGAEADLVLLDLETERTVSPERFRSKGKNTPFAGERLKGFPVMTLVKGEIVFKEDIAHA